MSQKKREPAVSQQAGARRPRRLLPVAVVGALLVLGGGVFYYFYSDEPPAVENTPRATTLAQRSFLPASGRIPRPPSENPDQFKDPEVRAAYQVARDNPALLEKMPCYCGCYGNGGHTSNYDCFVDNHGVT